MAEVLHLSSFIGPWNSANIIKHSSNAPDRLVTQLQTPPVLEENESF